MIVKPHEAASVPLNWLSSEPFVVGTEETVEKFDEGCIVKFTNGGFAVKSVILYKTTSKVH